jgi:murein DD-endopeptidase MepM/ murein hydrolase activator NlpD
MVWLVIGGTLVTLGTVPSVASAQNTQATTTTTTPVATATSTTAPGATTTTVPVVDPAVPGETTTTTLPPDLAFPATTLVPEDPVIQASEARESSASQSAFNVASRSVLTASLLKAHKRLEEVTKVRLVADSALAESLEAVAQLDAKAAGLGDQRAQQVRSAADAKARMRSAVTAAYMGSDEDLTLLSLVADPVTYSQGKSYLDAIAESRKNIVDDYKDSIEALDAVSRELAAEQAAAATVVAQRRTAADAAALAVLDAQLEVSAYEAGSHVFVPGFVFPVTGAVNFIDSWGFPRLAGTAMAHWHEGVDIMAPTGRTVVASESGVVFKVGTNTLGGNRLWVRGKSGTEFYYAHLFGFAPGIQDGSLVTAGTVLGYVGNTGDARGGPTHLHFEVHPGGGDAVNPFPLLRAAWGNRPMPTQAEALAQPAGPSTTGTTTAGPSTTVPTPAVTTPAVTTPR